MTNKIAKNWLKMAVCWSCWTATNNKRILSKLCFLVENH
nr:MAG TPA: hypothetical protein [Bacteriophage sp.]